MCLFVYHCFPVLSWPKSQLRSGSSLYFVQLLEVEAWLAERSFILETSDYGKNEESTQALLRKLEATKLDMDGFRPRIEKVQETGASLINKDSPER